MQRCCARIAGLRTLACRSNTRPLHATSLSLLQYVQHSDFLSRPHSTYRSAAFSHPRYAHHSAASSTQDVRHQDYDALVGADNDTFATLDSGLRGSSRQAAIRYQKAMHADGFAYIDPSKLPGRDASRSPKAWMPTIEAALPPRLRSPGAPILTDDPYSAQDISRIIHISSYTYDLDLLEYLASDLNRPKAAVWLAEMVISHNFTPDSTPPRDTNVWNTCLPPNVSLSTHTLHKEPLSFNSPPHNSKDDLPSTPSLDNLTAELHPHWEPLPDILRHETLGQIWSSLAGMIIRDATRANQDQANQVIRPEFLEIIAMLHHSGAMPSTIYSYSPPNDPISLCQPPTLHLLSNQIITSLTDAAWRAHETNVVEDAKERGGFYKSLRPEIPGSMYNVHVTGLGHEIWLELVLWAMLYGRFYKQGVQVLTRLSQLPIDNAWSVLSWRELANPIVQSGQEKSINWDEVKYIFNTGISDTDRTDNKKKVRRTVSAEVIASFVDAAVSHVSAGVGSRGMSPEHPGRFLKRMKLFFSRNNMSLGYTSWDAIILRFFESRGVDFEKDPELAAKISSSASIFGDDISTANAPTRDQLWQPTPAYVLDGSAASIGYYHRLLRAHIKLGSLPGAMSVVKDLQKLTDLNKQKSIQEFFAKQQDATTQDEDDETSEFGFQGRYGGIHYPSFFPQIPVPILADLVNLVVDSQALELGSWLLYSEDLDGPLVHKDLYSDPIMGPPLIRLAASLADDVLMGKVLTYQKGNSQTDPPEEVLNEILDQQVEAGNWPFVDKALEGFARLPGYSISTNTTATMIRVILREVKSRTGDLSALENSPSAKAFHKMSSLRTSGVTRGKHGYKKHDIVELGSRVWRLLALINDDWRTYAWKVYPNMAGYNHVNFTPRAFNRILSGVVDTYGSTAGKQYLGKFWPDSLEDEPLATLRKDSNSGGVTRMAARRQDTPVLTSPYANEVRGEHRIRIQGPGEKNATVIVSSQSGLNVATIHIILKQALKEADGQDTLVRQELSWTRRMMKKLGLSNSHIRNELRDMPELADHFKLKRSNRDSRHSAFEDDVEAPSPQEDDDGEFGDFPDHQDLNENLRDKARRILRALNTTENKGGY
ncbi:hypothetical protein E4T52_00799 [Aureobasidium sp. EXF-3400]|nr:hypothetical protein E4T51_00289 [Aureobasidium sp. EXF-12344]KAI4784279.1 hypothetical protein E4T52_00799 [Aureobasidium sp. EXF-3400]